MTEVKGLVIGLVVRSRGFSGNHAAFFRSLGRRRDPRAHRAAGGHASPSI
ncbi:MAG: hypothetical protein ACRDGJ_12975 [Candidatus Limnocylindria bacterium]